MDFVSLLLLLLIALVVGMLYAAWRLKGSMSWVDALRALHPRAPRPGGAETQGGGGGPKEPF